MRNTLEKVARARAGLLETVRFLVGAGANLNIQDKVINHLLANVSIIASSYHSTSKSGVKV